MTVETISLIIAIFVSASLAIAALLHDVRSRTCWRFALFVGLLCVHDALCLLETFPSGALFVSDRVHAVVVLLVGPAAWLFFRRVTNQRERMPLGVWAYFPLLVLTVLFTGKKFSAIGPWILVFAHLAFILAAGAIVRLLVKSEMEATILRDKLRLRYALWGAVITIAFFVTDALYFSGFDIVPLGTAARLLYIIFLFQTFIRKELITLQELLGKLVLFGGIASILSGIYLLLVSWVGVPSRLFFFNTFIASFVILVLFDPVRKLTHRFTQRILVQRNSMIEDALNALAVDVRGLVEPAVLFERVRGALEKCLPLRRVRFFVVSRDHLSFVEVGTSEHGEIYASDPLIQYMSLTKGRPFLPESIQNDRDTFYAQQPQMFFRECLEAVRRLGADLVIPCVQENSVMGFVAVSLQEEAVLSHEQLRLFIPVSKQIASQLKSAQIFSELRNRDKLATAGEMAAGLAHEIKNPLGAIKGAAQLLSEQADKGQQEFLKVIIDETDRLSHVLSDFLEYARPHRGDAVRACDPLKVIEHVRTLMGQKSSVPIRIVSGKSPSWVRADAEILKQVLLNLMMNAMDAMEGLGAGAELVIRVQDVGLLSRGKTSVEISIADVGCGIASGDREKVFLPFYTTKPSGTGLGLAICQSLVEGMEGSIALRENRPQGTVVLLHLPALAKRQRPSRMVEKARGLRKRKSEKEWEQGATL